MAFGTGGMQSSVIDKLHTPEVDSVDIYSGSSEIAFKFVIGRNFASWLVVELLHVGSNLINLSREKRTNAFLFLPEASSGLRVLSSAASVCQCVYVCQSRACPHDNSSLIQARRCKTPWLRSLLFLGMINIDLQGQIELESHILPHFELVCTITHQPFKLESPNLDRNAS